MLVERDGRGITEDNQKLSSRGRTTTGTTTNNGNEKPLRPEKTLTEPRENAMLLELRNQANQNWGRTKRNATLLERHATPRKLRVQRKHNVGTWPPHAPKRHTAGQESAPMLTNNGKRYKRKHIHATTLQTTNTLPKNAKNTRDHSS